MTHYDVLGVAPSADAAQVRRAYLRLAREHHPDRHAAGGPAARDEAERRMREVNEAWAVLSDPERRRRYDAQRRRAHRPGHADPGAWRAPNSPNPGWVPPDDGDDWDPADLDDTPLNPTRPRSGLTMLPVAAFAGGFLLLVVGLVTSLAPLLAFGVVGVVLSGVLFLAVPFLTMAESRRRDLESGP